jgi:hypothetical protein
MTLAVNATTSAKKTLRLGRTDPKWKVYEDPDHTFRPDLAPLLTDDAVGFALADQPFVVARTMPQWPHAYLLRDRYTGNVPWENLMQHTRDHGRIGYFGKGRAARMYWCYGGYRYWTMGFELNVTSLINRDDDVDVPYLVFD